MIRNVVASDVGSRITRQPPLQEETIEDCRLLVGNRPKNADDADVEKDQCVCACVCVFHGGDRNLFSQIMKTRLNLWNKVTIIKILYFWSEDLD